MNLQPLAFRSEYVSNIYYNPETDNSYDIKKVEQVVIKYKDGKEKTYDLFYDVKYERDMGCSIEIIKCYVLEELEDFTVQLYLSTILNEGYEVFVVDGDKYEIKPQKEPTIEELLKEKEEIEEQLKDECLSDIDRVWLTQKVICIDFRINLLKSFQQVGDWFNAQSSMKSESE